MRIGLHVGRVVAGVIGTKKLRYDIWGEDVLTATTMESSGIPGEVCVSGAWSIKPCCPAAVSHCFASSMWSLCRQVRC